MNNKNLILTSLYTAVFFITVYNSYKLIYDIGFLNGHNKRDADLDKLAKKCSVSRVIDYPFPGEGAKETPLTQEIVNENVKAANSNAEI